MMEMESYFTVQNTTSGEYKEKGSRFIGYIAYITSRSEFEAFLDEVKKEHHKARHHCWAYRCGIEQVEERSSDDGEPSGSAGRPILNQIRSNDLHQVGIVVVRYFGGTKLGVSGLIRSYKQGAIEAIKESDVVQSEILNHYRIEFKYQRMNEVMQVAHLEESKEVIKSLTDQPYIQLGFAPSETNTAMNKVVRLLNQKTLDFVGELPMKDDYFEITYLGRK